MPLVVAVETLPKRDGRIGDRRASDGVCEKRKCLAFEDLSTSVASETRTMSRAESDPPLASSR